MLTVAQYRVLCRGGRLVLCERDVVLQPDGRKIRAGELTEGHSVPGLGRVLKIEPTKEIE
jgi:hypothetical protein